MNENINWYRKRFDVIVIGAGIGGLCAASILAKNGKKVLLVDKCDQVGGRGRCTEYNGYILSHAFRSLAAEHVNKAKEMSGAEFRLSKVPMPIVCFFNVVSKKVFDMPVDMGEDTFRWLADLGLSSPEEAESFISLLGATLNEEPNILKRLDEDRTSFKEYIENKSPNIKFQKTLYDISHYSSHGIFIWENFAAGDYFTKIMPCLAGKNIDIFNGDLTDQAISNGFAEAFLKNGGEIMLLSEVRKVYVKNNKVTGVLIQDNHHDTWLIAESDNVVSNLPIRENLSIVNPDLFPEVWKENLQRYKKFQGMAIGISFGLRKKVTEITPWIRLVSPNPETGTQSKYEGGAFFLSNESPGHAPAGNQLFYIEKFMGEEMLDNWDLLDGTVKKLKNWVPELFESLIKKGLCSDSFENVVEMEKVMLRGPPGERFNGARYPNRA